jgi:CBS domain containing-hemolysin-like protein
MNFFLLLLILASSLLLVLYSYVSRLYSEKGRFLFRDSKDNVDFFEEQIEPALGIGMEKAELTFPLLVQLDLVLLVLLTASWNLRQPLHWDGLVQGGVFVVLNVILCAHVIPAILLLRTSGQWLQSCTRILRISILLVSPLVAISQAAQSLVSLGKEEEEAEEPSPSENIEALMLAGEEEGFLEKEDRQLIQSVVEFGDKTVREVMKPRPDIVAVPADTTVDQLKQMLTQRRFSRIPVYEGDLDHIIGFVHAMDLFALSDAEAFGQSVRGFARPLLFVPETKPIAKLLKDLQQTTPMAIVVDEYGSVAGLVTVEDMVEEIVGEIRDEHEAQDVIPQGEGTYSVPGNLDLDRLQELFGTRVEEPGDASTVSGLITGALGRVPAPGESLERDGLTFQVTESNGRKVVRLVVTGPVERPPVAVPSSDESPDAPNSSETS